MAEAMRITGTHDIPSSAAVNYSAATKGVAVEIEEPSTDKERDTIRWGPVIAGIFTALSTLVWC